MSGQCALTEYQHIKRNVFTLEKRITNAGAPPVHLHFIIYDFPLSPTTVLPPRKLKSRHKSVGVRGG